MKIQTFFSLVIMAMGVALSGCNELLPPDSDSEIVVIGNGMDLTGPRIGGAVVANVRHDAQVTSYVVGDGKVLPALTDAASGEKLSVEVTEVSSSANGNELIRVKSEGGACQVFEREESGNTVCREDLDPLPMAENQLPEVLEEEPRIVYLRDDQSLVVRDEGEAEVEAEEVVLAVGVKEYFVYQESYVIFKKTKDEWFYRDLAGVMQEPVTLWSDIVFEGPDGELLGFGWENLSEEDLFLEPSQQTSYGLKRIDLEREDSDWVWRGSSELLIEERLSPIQRLADGSVILHLKERSAWGKEQSAYYHISRQMDDISKLPLELPVEGVDMVFGRRRLLVSYPQMDPIAQKQMSTCMFENEFYFRWMCRPLEFELDRPVLAVALSADDDLVMGLGQPEEVVEEESPVEEEVGSGAGASVGVEMLNLREASTEVEESTEASPVDIVAQEIWTLDLADLSVKSVKSVEGQIEELKLFSDFKTDTQSQELR